MGFLRAHRKWASASPIGLLWLIAAGGASLTGGCSPDHNDPAPSNEGGASGQACLDGGGPVPGEVDAHCTDSDGSAIVQETRAAACMDSSAGGATDGAGGAAPEEEEEEELTLFNAEGDDDDCKYHVAFSASCVERNRDVTLTLHASNRSDESALVGATPTTEIFLSDTHPAPNTKPKAVMVEPGVYTIGPVQFDKPGRWTLRFHLFEECLDAREDSPHGHVAFYVDVP
jgi:hypothetical protein